MITIQKEISPSIPYPLRRIGPPEQILFFDIETTGFSGDYSNLYLIGCVYFQKGRWQLLQWFADTADSEAELLHAFFHFLSGFRYLLHFNGERFDKPYLLKRCAAYGLSYHFDGIESVDLYLRVKPFKSFLGLESLKQKSIEQFLEIAREDQYSGGQLIEIYEEYLVTRRRDLYRLLILHNEDDLKGMPAILPILSYADFLNGPFSFLGQELSERSDYRGQKESRLLLHFESPILLPIPVDTVIAPPGNGPEYEIALSGHLLTLSVPLLEGELKRFYEDYQNYFYLIYEDNAIHKSIGQYVEREARKKATAKTCYTRLSGRFLPQPCELWEPCLKENCKARQTYGPFTEALFQDGEQALCYLKNVLKLRK